MYLLRRGRGKSNRNECMLATCTVQEHCYSEHFFPCDLSGSSIFDITVLVKEATCLKIEKLFFFKVLFLTFFAIYIK